MGPGAPQDVPAEGCEAGSRPPVNPGAGPEKAGPGGPNPGGKTGGGGVLRLGEVDKRRRALGLGEGAL